MYLPWFPCVDCARAMVQTGIIELIGTKPDLRDVKWGDDFAVALKMLEEAGVAVRYIVA